LVLDDDPTSFKEAMKRSIHLNGIMP